MPNEDEKVDEKFDKMKVGEENVLCSRCGGIGSLVIKASGFSRYGRRVTKRKVCPKCKGKGKIDWITSIMAREEK